MLTPVDFQVPATHELAMPPPDVDPLPPAEAADPEASRAADPLGDAPGDPLDVQAASPKVSPAAATASLVSRIGTPPYTNTRP
jgi:hypothetical protein